MPATGTVAPSRLQALPPELRTRIYEHVAIKDTRTVLGWKLLKSHENVEHDGNLRRQFQSATIQQPLSMTCHQTRTEFNLVYNANSASAYKLIVNDFDLQQLALFRQFINRYCTAKRNLSLVDPPPSLQRMTICFQLHCNVVESTRKLVEAVEKRQFFDVLPTKQCDFVLLFENHSSNSKPLDEKKAVTAAQAKQALKMLKGAEQRGSFMLRYMTHVPLEEVFAQEALLLGLRWRLETMVASLSKKGTV